ncbi:hypothetical protein [Aeoliella sp. SH292]|uniref:hypothetical protein n=1 Tax=Aeoliella sp. SH292 TaxID=3454464 RepID=UPI003F95DB8E
MNSFLRIAASVVALAALPTARSDASLQASDSYVIGATPTSGEYTDVAPTNQLKNQSPDLTNLGFAVGPYNQGSGTGQFGTTSLGLTYAPLGEAQATSGKVNYTSAPLDSIVRSNARGLSGVSPSNTYWISHLVNRGNIDPAGGSGYVLTGFGNNVAPQRGATTGFLEGAFVGFAQDPAQPDNFGSLVIRSRTTAAQEAADTVLIDGSTTSTFGTTYAVVMKIDISSNGAEDTISWWLNPQNFLSEATLTSSAAASGSFQSFAFPTDTIIDRLNYSSQNWNGNAFFDAPRLSTTLEGLGGVAIEGLPGDYNDDGLVNLADYTVWRDNLGGDAAAVLPAGSRDPGNADPTINAADYEFWKQNFGSPGSAGVGPLGETTIPEPSTWTIFALAGTALVSYRRLSRRAFMR